MLNKTNVFQKKMKAKPFNVTEINNLLCEFIVWPSVNKIRMQMAFDACQPSIYLSVKKKMEGSDLMPKGNLVYGE